MEGPPEPLKRYTPVSVSESAEPAPASPPPAAAPAPQPKARAGWSAALVGYGIPSLLAIAGIVLGLLNLAVITVIVLFFKSFGQVSHC